MPKKTKYQTDADLIRTLQKQAEDRNAYIVEQDAISQRALAERNVLEKQKAELISVNGEQLRRLTDMSLKVDQMSVVLKSAETKVKLLEARCAKLEAEAMMRSPMSASGTTVKP